ncbi:MAG: hypothetical protein IJD60_10745 [Clostridia bacterium]|nr:hypothetical protein [Clostridia bacterium]
MKKNTMIVAAILVIVIAAACVAFVAMSEKQEQTDMAVTTVQTGTDAEQQETAADLQDVSAEVSEEAESEAVELFGTVTEITDAYILLDAGEMGMVQANLMEDTIIEGAEAIEIGQVVRVVYDGKMTRSIPAQITALLVGVYAVEGEVTEIADGRITVKRADTGEEVIITLPENAQEIAVGDAITAYTTGAMTMSLPPQMNAVAIVK